MMINTMFVRGRIDIGKWTHDSIFYALRDHVE
jgi:hypothetical protein